MTGYDRSRDRTEPDEGHVARVLQPSYYRRDAWARNDPPWSVEQVWVDRHFGGTMRLWLCPGCERRCRFVYGVQDGWSCHRCTGLGYRSAKTGPGDDRAITVAANRPDEYARRFPDAVEIVGPGRYVPRVREPGRHRDRRGRISRISTSDNWSSFGRAGRGLMTETGEAGHSAHPVDVGCRGRRAGSLKAHDTRD